MEKARIQSTSWRIAVRHAIFGGFLIPIAIAFAVTMPLALIGALLVTMIDQGADLENSIMGGMTLMMPIGILALIGGTYFSAHNIVRRYVVTESEVIVRNAVILYGVLVVAFNFPTEFTDAVTVVVAFGSVAVSIAIFWYVTKRYLHDTTDAVMTDVEPKALRSLRTIVRIGVILLVVGLILAPIAFVMIGTARDKAKEHGFDAIVKAAQSSMLAACSDGKITEEHIRAAIDFENAATLIRTQDLGDTLSQDCEKEGVSTFSFTMTGAEGTEKNRAVCDEKGCAITMDGSEEKWVNPAYPLE